MNQPILDFVRELADAQDVAKRMFVVVNPAKSSAWSVKQMWLSNAQGAWKRGFWRNYRVVEFDMCRLGLEHVRLALLLI